MRRQKIEKALGRLKGVSSADEIYPQPRGFELRYRKVFSSNSTFVAMTHFVKSLFAPSILAIPSGFLNGGLIFSIFGYAAVVSLVAFNLKTLVNSAAYLSEREHTSVRTYDELAYLSFKTSSARTKNYAAAVKLIVNLMFFVTNLDACTIFMIFVARNMECIIVYYYPNTFLDVRFYLFFQVVLLMCMSSVRHLKYLAPFAFISSFLMLAVVVLTIAFFFVPNMPSPLERTLIGSPHTIIRFISVVLFSLSGISIALTIKSSMLKPQYFFSCPGIYNLSLTVVCLLAVTFGFLGYLQYGPVTEASVMLNLPADNVLAICIKLTAILSVLLTSPLVFYIAFNVLWNNYIRPHISQVNVIFAEFVLRYGLIILSYLIASAAPYLGFMIVLKGALFHSHLEVTIPAILDYVTFYPEKGTGKFHIRLLKAVIIILIGLFFCVSGTVVGILDLLGLP